MGASFCQSCLPSASPVFRLKSLPPIELLLDFHLYLGRVERVSHRFGLRDVTQHLLSSFKSPRKTWRARNVTMPL